MLGLPPPPRQMNQRLRLARPILPTNSFLLKARKNFDLPTDCISFLNSTKYKKLSGKTIKLLLSQHAKKKPFGKISLGSKVPPKAKIIGRNVKNFSYFTENQDPEFQKSEKRLLRFIAYSYKYLECLDATKLDIQNRSSLASISKLNHLQSVSMKIHIGKYLPGPRFFQSLKHLRHITLSITEAPQNSHTDLAKLAEFFYRLALFPSLESYNIDLHVPSTTIKKSAALIETIFSYLSLIKAKRFLFRVHCIEALVETIQTFKSFLENVDTFECNYRGAANAHVNFETIPSKKLILILSMSPQSGPFETILDHCCSLENLYLEQYRNSMPPAKLNLPETLKSLTLKLTSLEFIRDLPQFIKAWKEQFLKLKNLENLCIILAYPCQKALQWISQLSLKGLKSYHFKLQDGSLEQKEDEDHLNSFLLKWSENLQNFCNLEDLSIEITSFRLDSLDFVTKSLANLPKLKRIRLHLNLHSSQPKEMLKLSIPCENLPQLEHLSLTSYQFLSKDSAAQLLRDIINCKNLQSLKISGLDFDEVIAICAVKKLKDNERKDILKIISKKEILRHNSLFYKRRMLGSLKRTKQ